MPHADIHHLHVSSKKVLFSEKPAEATVSYSTLHKIWNKEVEIPLKTLPKPGTGMAKNSSAHKPIT